jgi:outer membrane receptor protein involved in Fe transport
VFLDGVPLTTASSGVFDLSSIPATMIGRISVYRSDAPVALGPPAPGGIVHLETRFDEASGTFAAASAGSWGMRRLQLAHQLDGARGELLVSGLYSGAQNDFRYFDDGGTPFNPDDDSQRMRRNAHVDSGAVLVRHRARVNSWRLTTLGLGAGDAMGVPGPAGVDATQTDYSRARILVAHRAESARLGHDDFDLALLGALSLTFERYADPGDELGLGVQDEQQRGSLALLGVHPTWLPGDHVEVRGTLDGDIETLAASGRSSSARDAQRERLGAGAEIEVDTWQERARALVGVRLDHTWSHVREVDASQPHQHMRTHLAASPRAGLSLGFVDTEHAALSAHANTGIAERVPSFYELYGDRGATVGNPALRPESRRGWDAGARLEMHTGKSDASLSWTYFDRRIDDLIVVVETGLGVATPINITRAAMRGHELALGGNLGEWVRIRGTYTLMDAIERRPDAADSRLPGRPRHSGAVMIGGGWRWIDVEATVRADGETTTDREGLRPIPARSELDAQLTLRPEWRWRPTFALVVRNVLDQRTATVELPDGGEPVSVRRAITDLGGLPLPGRAVYGVITIRPSR